MARRPSAVSVNSVVSSSTNAEFTRSPSTQNATSAGFQFKGGPSWPPRSDSLRVGVDAPTFQNDIELDPDDLFAQYPVSEVKAIQLRLRADAEDKQEELRLMVGERYRDLLQASTSIISIARSSKRVKEALEEAKNTIISQEQSPEPRRTHLGGKDEAHVKTLQSLSAHIKLLLDAPEHLWRLIERKKYLEATWFFLLARVVHRALVRDDDQDEENWNSQGIDVLEQFPLVQRQWETVSQFRPQIIHKATLSLREYTTTAEDTCATLLTLHLIDSRPVIETLSVLLAQRTKILNNLLSKAPQQSGSSAVNNMRSNGDLPKSIRADRHGSSHPATSIQEVKQATQATLEAISSTIRDARLIFHESAERRSMFGQVLEYMQSDPPNPTTSQASLPTELMLTTQALLTSLPSSSYFLLLPSNLRTYKPYVDLSSSASAVCQPSLIQRLDEWFNKMTKHLQETAEKWFSSISSAKEVWKIRSWVRKWVHSKSGLDQQEEATLTSLLDVVFRHRVIELWNLALLEAGRAFQERISSNIAALEEESRSNATDIHTNEYLFQRRSSNLFPIATGATTGKLSFSEYKRALRQQIIGRNSHLEGVLSILECCTREAFSLEVNENDVDTRTLASQLAESFQPAAEKLCFEVVNTLDAAANRISNDSSLMMHGLGFISQIAEELSNSSPFISKVGCGAAVTEEFRQQTKALHNQLLDRWQNWVVNRIVHTHQQSIRASYTSSLSESPVHPGPSPILIQSLYSLSSSVQQLTIGKDQTGQENIAQVVLRQFTVGLLIDLEEVRLQVLWDLMFLRRLACIWDDDQAKLISRIDEKAMQIRRKLQSRNVPSDDSDIDISEHLARIQVLLTSILPASTSSVSASLPREKDDKFAPLLPYGVPSTDTQFHPAMELAKPSARFGLLLIGGTTG